MNDDLKTFLRAQRLDADALLADIIADTAAGRTDAARGRLAFVDGLVELVCPPLKPIVKIGVDARTTRT